MSDGDGVDHGELGHLATELGVQTWFWDTQGHRRDASHDGLLAVLRALGAPVDAGRGPG